MEPTPEALRTSNPNAVAVVTQWLDASPAADCPTLRQSLADAIAQVAPGDATANARKALDSILSQFSVGTPEQIAGQLQTFVNKAGDVRNALNYADGKLKDLARSLSPLLDDADETSTVSDATWKSGSTTAWSRRGLVQAAHDGMAGNDRLHPGRGAQRRRAADRANAVQESGAAPKIASQAQAYANEPHPSLERRSLDLSSAAAPDAKAVNAIFLPWKLHRATRSLPRSHFPRTFGIQRFTSR